MKKILVEEDITDALENLLGEVVTLFCLNYFYTGRLVAIDSRSVQLENPKIVYETGDFKDQAWKDAQALPQKVWNVMIGSIESFGVMKI